ncbi:diguanylate cyclase [Nocardia flavorosea]|uniref:diguanylate cyclase domain-containing protein n=1 Tax=Nocardia flavorosea TaxID=53429 RepID=UPI001893F778|nr:diguanylate cyclase [Nocardia flavorosea]MBF6351640.1 diguanylate cyclase [Nocardia flavorosea]
MGDRRASAAEQLAHRYRSLVEHSPDGICVHERGIVVYANPACLRILGAKNLAEVLGQDIARFVHPDSRRTMFERIAGLTATGIATDPTEMILLALDGREVPTETVSVLTAWHDRLAYQVVIHDLSAQRRAERAQRRAEQHFTTVVAQLEEGVAVIYQGGIIGSANPAARRILGIDDQMPVVGSRIAQLPVEWLDANGAPMPPARHPVARTLATGETVTAFVFAIGRPDGRRRWLSVSSRLLAPDEPGAAAVCSFTDITEYLAGRRQLEYQATHDPLTGLANRSLILSQLSGALAASGAHRRVSTVMFIDLDGFKSINDTMGHAIGDTVLRIVAHRLQRALRAEDLVGRLGGDEFLVLLAGRPGDGELEPLVQRLRAAMAEPIVARGHRIAVNASIGVTTLEPGDTRTPEAVLHDADIAMYEAKPPGRHDATRGRGLRGDNSNVS